MEAYLALFRQFGRCHVLRPEQRFRRVPRPRQTTLRSCRRSRLNGLYRQWHSDWSVRACIPLRQRLDGWQRWVPDGIHRRNGHPLHGRTTSLPIRIRTFL